MSGDCLVADDLPGIAQDLLLLVPKPLIDKAVELHVRAEIGDGHGRTDLYLVDHDGQVFHRFDQREVVGLLFERLYALPAQLDGLQGGWNSAHLCWRRNEPSRLELLRTDISFDAKERRQADWERQVFQGKRIERVVTEPFHSSPKAH